MSTKEVILSIEGNKAYLSSSAKDAVSVKIDVSPVINFMMEGYNEILEQKVLEAYSLGKSEVIEEVEKKVTDLAFKDYAENEYVSVPELLKILSSIKKSECIIGAKKVESTPLSANTEEK